MLSLRQTWHGALSTARGTKLYHYWRPDDTMFNRTREIAEITKVFLSKPQLSIITGPVNSGKTRFMNEVLSKLPSVTSCPTPILHIHCKLKAGNLHVSESFRGIVCRKGTIVDG